MLGMLSFLDLLKDKHQVDSWKWKQEKYYYYKLVDNKPRDQILIRNGARGGERDILFSGLENGSRSLSQVQTCKARYQFLHAESFKDLTLNFSRIQQRLKIKLNHHPSLLIKTSHSKHHVHDHVINYQAWYSIKMVFKEKKSRGSRGPHRPPGAVEGQSLLWVSGGSAPWSCWICNYLGAFWSFSWQLW